MYLSYGATHPGRVRTENQDCFGIFTLGDATLYAVCDGVGGQRGGKTAAHLALQHFADTLRDALAALDTPARDDLSLAHIKRLMRGAAAQASRAVRAAAAEDASLHGMASTLVAALVRGDRAYVLHVGDSRLYVVHAGGTEKVTRDHSYLQYLLDVGRITPEQAAQSEAHNYITQAIGAYDHVDGDFCALALTAYDAPTYLLLCSDGLYSMLPEHDVQRILLGDGCVRDKVTQLIAQANDAGGRDNVTALVVACHEDGAV